MHDATKQKLAKCLTITEMEELAKGRILSKFIPEIINAREATKWKKCETLLQTTNTWNYLKSNRAVVGLVLRILKDEHTLDFGEGQMFIDSCHEFLCCVPDGNLNKNLVCVYTFKICSCITAVSKDGCMILLIRKKESTGNITELASKTKGFLGCKLKSGEITLDRNTNIEIQAAMHISSKDKCLIFFMMGSNTSNYLFKIVEKDEAFFASKIEVKLKCFFDEYFLKKLAEKQVLVKQ